MLKVLELIKNHNIKSVLDIGANQGVFSYMIKRYFPNVDVFMLEANPWCDGSLKKTGLPYEIACLSDTEKEVQFYIEDTNFMGTGASYYLEKTHHYSQKNFINMKTSLLDNVIVNKFVDQKGFDLIKLDTQGSEIDIMNGGKKTVEQAKFIVVETSIEEYNENAPLKAQMFDYLASVGFKPMEKIEDHYHEGRLVQEDWIFSR